MRGATKALVDLGETDIDFNSRTSCEVRQYENQPDGYGGTISTHAPHARCDMLNKYGKVNLSRNFNSRTSCEVRL